MKILLINHYAGSPEMGMEFRPYYMAQEWIRQGHEVDIIAADYSHLRRKNPKVQRDWQIEEIDGIRYHWLRTGDYDGNGVRRALTMFRFVGKIWLMLFSFLSITYLGCWYVCLRYWLIGA